MHVTWRSLLPDEEPRDGTTGGDADGPPARSGRRHRLSASLEPQPTNHHRTLGRTIHNV